MNIEHKKLALYTDQFLTPSMTFIHRQLTSLPMDWQTFVLARTRKNELLFPYKNVYCSRRNLNEKVMNKLRNRIGFRYTSLSKQSSNYFLTVLNKEKPSLIHAHFGPSALEILPLAKHLSIPMVTTFHGFDASSMLNNHCYIKQLKELFAYSFVITVSEAMRSELIALGSPQSRTSCAYIGVPVDKFKQHSRTPIIEKIRANLPINFLQVSNFVEKKGHEYTLTAFSELLKYCPNAKLQLAGDGPLKEKMEYLADELDIRNAVDFLGHMDTNEVIKLMEKGDCFVHHSVTALNGDKEGIPTVLMEAMASGLPVISTMHAGIPELILTKVNGYLVEEKNIEEYVNTLRSVLEDDGSIGVSARETVESKFNMNKQIQLLTLMYEKLITEKFPTN